MRALVRNLLIWPYHRVVCFQTLYEALFACMDFYIVDGRQHWRDRATMLARMISSKQNRDGGFDIGYNFVFGTGLWKKSTHESTAPEMLGLYALYRYKREIGDADVGETITLGINWILQHAYQIDRKKWAISYAPGTLNEVHIVNGCSFTLPALAYHLVANEDDKIADRIFRGMLRFLLEEMEDTKAKRGKYWRYFYRGGKNFSSEVQREKIDNYHMGQQLRYHCTVQQLIPTEENLEIIENLVEYLLSIRNEDGIYEYCDRHEYFPNNVHIWSFSSAIKGFIEAYKVTGKTKCLKAAEDIKDWIIQYSWNGEFFYPVLDLKGKVLDSEYYPKTNAWAMHSLAHYMKVMGQDVGLLNIVTTTYDRLKRAHFKGKERNVWTKRLILATRAWHILNGRSPVV